MMCDNHYLLNYLQLSSIAQGSRAAECRNKLCVVLEEFIWREMCSQLKLAAEKWEEQIHLNLGRPVRRFAKSQPICSVFNTPV